MQAKITKLNRAENSLVGMKIPKQNPNDPGNIGRLTEDVMINNGYRIEKTQVVDMPDLGIEQKTRKIGSRSGHTVCKMTIEDIINTPWEDSPVRQKMQRQFRIEYDDDEQVIVEAKIYDFTMEEIQRDLKVAYETARELFKKGNIETYVRGKDCGVPAAAYFENTTKDIYWDFRIPDNKMNDFKTISINDTHHGKLFERSLY